MTHDWKEPGQGRRDLRRHTKPGALKKGHQQPKKGCGGTTAAMMLLVLALVGACLVGVL